MKFESTTLSGVILITPTIFSDERGHFFEAFNQDVWAGQGFKEQFVQDNQSYSTKGVIRGLHFQKQPYAQGKLVRVIKGRVLDVAVDMREDSPTFGKFETFELDAITGKMVYIPEGFAHGFAALEESIFHYKCTGTYNKGAEAGILWSDPSLAIPWRVTNPVVSEKDQILPSLDQYLKGSTK